MPTYNRAHLVEPVIRTILEQDYKESELIIIDDGSQDNTSQVIGEISKSEPRVQYVRLSKNQGVGYARNVGLEHMSATARYVALADSDDLWLPGRLRKQIEVLEKYQHIDMIFGDFDNVDHVRNLRYSGIKASRMAMNSLVISELEPNLYLIEGGIERGILQSNFVATPTLVLRRAVFDKVGRFNQDLRTSEDLEFNWRAGVLGARFSFINQYLIERHRYWDSLTAQEERPWLERLHAIEIMTNTCVKFERSDLVEDLRATELRTFRNLIRIYSERGESANAVRTFVRSMKYGPSLRTSGLFLVGMLGPKAISYIQHIRAKIAQFAFYTNSDKHS